MRLESLTDNPKRFWTHLKSIKGNGDPGTLKAISPNSWVEHFSKLFHCESVKDESYITALALPICNKCRIL